MGFDTSTIFVMLLPPIIFNSGYTPKRRFFFKNISDIRWFVIVGTIASTIVVVGVLLYVAGCLGISVRLSVTECLTFGALISSTDPASTLAIFQELHVDPILFYIVFGESLLNGAVDIALLTTFAKIIGVTFTTRSTLFALLDFGLVFVISTIVGLGLALFSVTQGYDLGLVACSMFFCFLGRAAHVEPIATYPNRSISKPLSANQQHVLWFSGLRGAVAYALASPCPGAHHDYIVATIVAIVLLTEFFIGGSTVSMLARL